MGKILVFVLFIYIVGDISVKAQPFNMDELKKWQLKGYAKSAKRQGDLYLASLFNSKLYEMHPQKIKYLKELAWLQYKLRNYSEAKRLYTELDSLKKNKSVEAKYYLALNLKHSGAYESAYKLFRGIKRASPNRRMPKDFKNRIVAEMEGCELGIALRDSSVSKEVSRLNSSINKGHIEFNPFYLTDSVMVYGSSNINSVKYYSADEELPKRRFYLAKYVKGNWEGEKEVEGPFFNSPEFDTGDGVFSLDGNRFYFVQSQRNWKQKMISHLYVTELVNGVWEAPQKLNDDINLKNYIATEPAVGTCFDPNLEVLYFVSDRPGGYGETDLWYTVYDVKNKRYEKAINAGIFINTSGSETTPMFDPSSHLLYFSSDGWPGLGGLDVFAAEGDMVNWNEPKNLAFPINTSFDDLYFSISDYGNGGFLTSNRPGGEALAYSTSTDDIFIWNEFELERVWVRGNILGNHFEIINLFENQNQSNRSSQLDSAQVNIYLKKDSSNLVFIDKIKTDANGAFEFLLAKELDFELFIDDSRVLDKVINFNTKNIKSEATEVILKPHEVKIISDDPIVLANIHFDINKSALTEESKAVLNNTLVKFMKRYSDLLVEISSHTDNKASSKFNQKLSQRRAESVIDYLEEMGIESFRLKAIGYGEKKPIATNTNPDGSDNPEGRAQNNRTEFRLVEQSEMRN